MKRWIVEEDCDVVQTTFYAVEAETRDGAIRLVMTGNIEPQDMKTYGGSSHYRYDDTHEAAEDE